MRCLLASLIAVVVALTAPAAVSAAPKPVIERGKGDRCVEDTEFMRRNHMKVLMHQRDDTVHQGIRTKKHSLQGCIECHASSATGSVAAAKTDFCQSCHEYAAVKLDCWECHSTKPTKTAASAPVVERGAQ